MAWGKFGGYEPVGGLRKDSRRVTARHVVVTGGRGYLGSHLVPELLAAHGSVTVIDTTPCPTPSPADVRHVRHDVRDRPGLRESFAGADVVIHAAFAPPHAPRAEMRDVNVGGVDAVCDTALSTGVRRVVVLSSTVVDRRVRPHPVFRNAPVSRLAEYAASRRAAETIAMRYATRGLEVAIVHPKTFVGPGRVGGFALVFDLVPRGDAVPLLGSGRSRYQLVDVRDLARGVAALAAQDAQGVVGFGAADFGSIREDLGRLIDHAGTAARLRPLPGSVGRRALRAIELAGLPPLAEWHHCVAADLDSVVDIERARVELGWEPRRSNADALADAFDWYVAKLTADGAGITTHPVPIAHRALRKAAGVILR
jgi:nucleoside-diphosphate-sugar epimerase